MSEYVVTLPSVDAVTLSPNPVNVGASFTLIVMVSEIQKILKPEELYSGEFYSNEV